jgi:hypothetical protein
MTDVLVTAGRINGKVLLANRLYPLFCQRSALAFHFNEFRVNFSFSKRPERVNVSDVAGAVQGDE